LEKIIFIEVTLANASPSHIMVQVSKIVDFWELRTGKCSMLLGGEEVLILEETYEEVVSLLSFNSAISIYSLKKK
tara:strand:- start:13413 stop:13637 length:225 start_codon:yes stop_codon:yes gene_type:complete